MLGVQQQTRNAITLRGSVELVTEYLNYGINSILFQRGIYPPESFVPEDHFGLSVYISTDAKIKEFLDVIMNQMKGWLIKREIKQMSLVICSISNQEPLERWDFKVEYDSENVEEEATSKKDIKIIQGEIQSVLRQICSTVSFLPLLDCPCSFDLHIYTDKDAVIPDQWDEREHCHINNSEEFKLRSFSTSFHRMNTIVSYKKKE